MYMKKILVNIRVPNLEKGYDVWISDADTIADVKLLISAAISELEPQMYFLDSECVLASIERNLVFQNDKSVEDMGIQMGEQLLLI